MGFALLINGYITYTTFSSYNQSNENIFLYLSIISLIVLTIAIFSIFSFKKRQNQFVLNRLAIIFNFILLVLFIYQSQSLSGDVSASMKGIEVILTLISIVLLVFANKYIKKDEDLVKSVDRIR
jgi:phosphatidylserine synthase